MKQFTIALFIFLYCEIACSQSSYDNFSIIPAKPTAGQVIEIHYRSVPQLLQINIWATVFLNQVGSEEPRAVEVKMKKTDEDWSASIPTSKEDVSLMVIFYDTLGTTDNNEEKGYWVPMFIDNEPAQGSLASIAYMYCGAWDASSYGITGDRNFAKKLYESDFKRNEGLRRIYYRYYISSIRHEKEQELFNRALAQFSSMSDLTEWELLDISKKYAAIRDTSNSKRIERELFQKYPLGCWSTQISTLDYQKNFFTCKDAKERKLAYQAFKNKFSGFTDDCTKRYLEGIEVIIFLRRLIVEYAKENNFDEWKKSADMLSEPAKYLAYFTGSQALNESKIFYKASEELSKEASEWMKRNLDAPRLVTDRLFTTISSVRKSREDRLAECLDAYGYSLLLQKRNDEAKYVFESALKYSNNNKKKDIIRIHYSESLMRNRSTKTEKNKNTDIIDKPKPRLIREELPNIILFERNGDSLNLKSFRKKIIVLDFWASWCGPCLIGFEKMNEIIENVGNSKEIIFLFINTQEKESFEISKEKARNIMNKLGFDFAVLFDSQNRASEVFKFSSLPTKMVIDRNGVIRFRQSGLSEENEIEEVIRLLSTER